MLYQLCLRAIGGSVISSFVGCNMNFLGFVLVFSFDLNTFPLKKKWTLVKTFGPNDMPFFFLVIM